MTVSLFDMGSNPEKFTDLAACTCPHILEQESFLDQDSFLERFEEKQLSSGDLECGVCQESSSNGSVSGQNLWMCLHPDCLQIFCSDTTPSHSLLHYTNDQRHTVHLNTDTLRVWCHECEVEIIIGDEDTYDPYRWV